MSESLMMALVIGCSVVMGLLVIVGIPVSLGLRHAARQRELEHIERLKALELGRAWPGEAAPGTSESTNWTTAIGVWVPLGALGIALASTSQSTGHSVAVWSSAGAVGVTAVICATILAVRTLSRTDRAASMNSHAKVAVAADEFGVVGRRD